MSTYGYIAYAIGWIPALALAAVFAAEDLESGDLAPFGYGATFVVVWALAPVALPALLAFAVLVGIGAAIVRIAEVVK